MLISVQLQSDRLTVVLNLLIDCYRYQYVFRLVCYPANQDPNSGFACVDSSPYSTDFP